MKIDPGEQPDKKGDDGADGERPFMPPDEGFPIHRRVASAFCRSFFFNKFLRRLDPRFRGVKERGVVWAEREKGIGRCRDGSGYKRVDGIGRLLLDVPAGELDGLENALPDVSGDHLERGTVLA